MVNRHGQELEQPKEFLERLLAMKIAKLQQTIDSLHALSSSYDKGTALLSELQTTTPPRPHGPMSTLMSSGVDGRLRFVTTSSPILQFANRPDIQAIGSSGKPLRVPMTGDEDDDDDE
ncbi:hypothetical protein GUITHDRAFT_143458 [Guillardia theta CCMP2712]|uniref:Uncharacterized protein n=1 Tax=Guillardia theta (strain CCMP2712) TaxID=905079 RepID=L1IU77_GUITC|nr:hypothetical protein GUITHDRAFT_143458 [Guillardia theta CCMP2712]EKX39459.1 hypothetical protein GUITHDRAFT_143458 [Guillardia theta CCMP2712]|eukprot:XP_005826439.1 hypothetical protein GUITHDRAFT_143458 [Guillardia theta CCMP2712]